MQTNFIKLLLILSILRSSFIQLSRIITVLMKFRFKNFKPSPCKLLLIKFHEKGFSGTYKIFMQSESFILSHTVRKR